MTTLTTRTPSTVAAPTATIDLTDRPVARTGLNPRLLAIELRRMMRNRRTFIFTLIFPVLMLMIVAAGMQGKSQPISPGASADIGAYVMVSMALYGVVMAATTAGAAVATERASGWSRQLRTSPLNPAAYIGMKMITALVLGLAALTVTYTAGSLSGVAHMAAQSWMESSAIVLAGALVFAAFGLFMGYLLPTEGAMQIVGPMMALLGFLGGLFQGPIDTSTLMGRIQSFTPIYGLSQLAHWPLTRTTSGAYGTLHMGWIANLVVWGAVFVVGAVWCFRKDTARV